MVGSRRPRWREIAAFQQTRRGQVHFFVGKMKDLIKSESTKVLLKKKQMEKRERTYFILNIFKHLATLDVRGGNDEKLFGGDHENTGSADSYKLNNNNINSLRYYTKLLIPLQFV